MQQDVLLGSLRHAAVGCRRGREPVPLDDQYRIGLPGRRGRGEQAREACADDDDARPARLHGAESTRHPRETGDPGRSLLPVGIRENPGHPVGINEKWNMAQVTKVRLVDDVDGGEADESVCFGLDGRSLEIDLSNENAEKLRAVFAPYIAAARRGGRQPARQQPVQRRPGARQPSPNTPGSPREDTGQIRAWAAANGFTDSARGRISSEVMQAYRNRSAGAQKPALPKVGNPFQVNAS
jgi:hypothetical protein